MYLQSRVACFIYPGQKGSVLLMLSDISLMSPSLHLLFKKVEGAKPSRPLHEPWEMTIVTDYFLFLEEACRAIDSLKLRRNAEKTERAPASHSSHSPVQVEQFI